MYLSKIQLRPEHAARPQFWDAVRDGYDVHQVVWGWFADSPDRRRDFLYRHEGSGASTRFFTLSERPPVDATGLWGIETKEFEPRLSAGDRLGFMVRVNPTRRKATGPGKGGRHDVVMDAKFRARERGEVAPPESELVQAEGLAWLAARAPEHGFDLVAGEARVESYTQVRFKRPRGGRDLAVSIMDMQGILSVREPEAFRRTLFDGLGPAKGFGCGLLLVRRA